MVLHRPPTKALNPRRRFLPAPPGAGARHTPRSGALAGRRAWLEILAHAPSAVCRGKDYAAKRRSGRPAGFLDNSAFPRCRARTPEEESRRGFGRDYDLPIPRRARKITT